MDEFKEEIKKIWEKILQIERSLKWLTDFQTAWKLAIATKPRRIILITVIVLIFVALLRQFGYSINEIWNFVSKIF